MTPSVSITQPQTSTTPQKTMSVPKAGRDYFGLSRNGSYAAAKRGDIPTIKLGKLLRVPIRALEAMLGPDLSAATTAQG